MQILRNLILNSLPAVASFFLIATMPCVHHRAYANEITLEENLADPSFQLQLDKITGSPRSKNHVELLHLGGKSFPRRFAEMNQAEHYIFQAVPHFWGDEAGMESVSAYREVKRKNPNLDLRFIFDWSSPLISNDKFMTKQFRELIEIAGRNQVQFWNDPAWKQPWSYNLLKYNLHSKVLIIDGKKMFVGGMNIADGYRYGGVDSRGWHDTDAIVEGPLVKFATAEVLRSSQFITHMLFSLPFPEGEAEKYALAMNWFHPEEFTEKEVAKTKEYGLLEPFQEKYLTAMEQRGFSASAHSDGVPTRLIFSNPLVDRNPLTGKEYSRFFETLKLVMERAHKKVRFLYPYPAMTTPMLNLITSTAKRGVEVEIITDSFDSTDLSHWGYWGCVGFYLPLVEAGVKLYEWEGHKYLLELERDYGCKIDRWPGHSLHSKAVTVDDDVTFLGSHNMNVRSDFYQTETMLMVESKSFNRDLQNVFDFDIDLGTDKTLHCRDGVKQRNRYVHPVSLEEAKRLTEEHKKDIEATKGLLYRI